MSEIDQAIEFLQTKRDSLDTEDRALEVLKAKDPLDSVKEIVTSGVSDNVLSNILNGPLSQLGVDFIKEQALKNARKVINNAIGIIEDRIDDTVGIPLRKTIQDAQQLVFNAISAAVTAKNDVLIFFLQNIAREAVLAIQDKRRILELLKEDARQLHNALSILGAGSPFFNEYIDRLRDALRKLFEAETKLTSVRNQFVATNFFSKFRFDDAKQLMVDAKILMEPGDTQPGVLFTDSGLFAGTGVPTEPQQIALINSIPELCKRLVKDSAGYFTATLRVNALLLAFVQGLDALTKGSSTKLRDYTIKLMDDIISKLDNLISKMGLSLNGSPDALLGPISTIVQPRTTGQTLGNSQQFQDGSGALSTVQIRDVITIKLGSDIGAYVVISKPSSNIVIVHKRFISDASGVTYQVDRPPTFAPNTTDVSTKVIGWILELEVLIEYMTTIPGQALTDIQLSNAAVVSYNKAVEDLETKDNRVQGDAVLFAEDGREDIGLLENQLLVYASSAMSSLVDSEVAASILSLGRTIITRLELSLTQDSEIEVILQKFIDTEIPFQDTINRLGSNIFDLLGDFGLDRSQSLLRSGQFTEFFNLNSKTATFAGAALIGIAKLKECLETAEEQDALTDAEREIQRDMVQRDLLVQRTSVSAFEQQRAQNKRTGQKLQRLQEEVRESGKRCGEILEEHGPYGIITAMGPALGIQDYSSLISVATTRLLGK